jgi:catechol 2,3-dioxygenase
VPEFKDPLPVPNSNETSANSFGIAPPRFRLPPATHVGGVHLQVSDLPQSVAYYEHVLGLRVHSATSSTVALGSHDSAPLVWLQTSNGVKPARRGALGLFHFAILLPEREALGKFAAHLSRTRVLVGMADHSVSEALYLWDPDGLGIEVYADRPRSAWRQRDRELVMTTDPLDISNVIKAGGNRPWEEMPSGTKIGHVHLHVGNLDEGERFYHAALGLDKTVWTYPGALFMAVGGYHHHLGTNTWSPGPRAKDDEARLLDWELVVPSAEVVSEAASSMRNAGYGVERTDDGSTAVDPWGTRVHIIPAAEPASPHDATTPQAQGRSS